MNRRNFVKVAALGTTSFMVPGTSQAEGGCSPPICDAFGNCVNVCSVGLPSNLMDFVAARQRSSQWCWAACIEMSFAAHGYIVPQEVFVNETFGGIVNMPGQPAQIIAALNRSYVDAYGRQFLAQGDVFSVDLQTAISDLEQRQPLIVGALGHATVLTALTWITNGYSLQIQEATVRDPWPGRPSKRALSAQEWFNVIFAARIRCWAL